MRNKVYDVLSGISYLNNIAKDSSIFATQLEKLTRCVELYPQVNWVDALSPGQTISKEWLIRSALDIWGDDSFSDTVMVGGWLGTLPFTLETRGIDVHRWVSVDIDQTANVVSRALNGPHFNAVDENMYEYDYSKAKLVINTACEHITDIDKWLALLPKGCKVILQTNNMFGIDDHVNCVNTLGEFINQVNGIAVEVGATKELPWHGWKRFMLLGEKS